MSEILKDLIVSELDRLRAENTQLRKDLTKQKEQRQEAEHELAEEKARHANQP